jgi:4-aminobutyrate aminotransferase-like enzyme
LVVNAIGDYILRFLPPLTVTAEEIDQAIEILQRAIAAV